MTETKADRGNMGELTRLGFPGLGGPGAPVGRIERDSSTLTPLGFSNQALIAITAVVRPVAHPILQPAWALTGLK